MGEGGLVIAHQQLGRRQSRELCGECFSFAQLDAAAAPARGIQPRKADDFGTAFTFASPNIKGIFGTAERFGQMVRQGYPMVHRPDDVRFLGLREDSGRTIQRVMIRDAQGRLHMLDYEMIETPEGWQINGVRLLPPQGAGA